MRPMILPQRFARVAGTLVLGVLLLVPAAQARKGQEDPAAEAAADQLSPEQRKQQAKEERIAEYLRKKEEQRLQREMEKEAAALEVEKRQLAEESAAAAAGAQATTPAPVPPPEKGAAHSALPKDLARAQERVRKSDLASDPTVQAIMAAIDQQLASAQQLAAFGNFVSEAGMHREALEYYRVAVRIEPDDPVLWVNLGTLHRKLGELSAAQSAYARALAIHPNYALAHYNIGAILDQRDKYEQAIESYKTALRLDPNLGDPEYNPQVVGNDLLTTVKLLLYEETIGTAGLPLVNVADGEADSDTP